MRKKDPITGKWFWDTPPWRKKGLSLHDFILSRTVVDKKTGCWNSTSKSKGTHPIVRHSALKGTTSIGRASWICFFGPIKNGLDVCHECDNGKCGNPMHLFLGTEEENMQDCLNKGRFSKGTNHYRAKINPKIAKAIRFMRASKISYPVIARRTGLSVGACWCVATGRTWK